jgi:hypothetical protein
MIALAEGAAWGSAAGIAATGFYTVGMMINPHIATSQVLTAGSTVRLITFASSARWSAGSPPTTATSPTGSGSPASATT